MSIQGLVVIRVDFPALTELIAFLKASEQTKVDAQTARVAKLTERLTKANKSLLDALVEEAKGEQPDASR